MMRRLVLRSALVLALLFGLLYAVGTALLYKFNLPLGWAAGFSITVVALQYLLGPYLIQWFFKIHWVSPASISPQLESFLDELSAKRGIPVPRFGIIEDGNPNAFTFGHLPSNARVVVTRGLVDMLDEDELNAVVAHEVGHVVHYDFLIMAVASVVPLILYNIYAWTRGDRRNQATFLVAMGAYAAYLLSQMAVLVLSRIREFFADEHAVESVKDANAISRALVKIAYGLARMPLEAKKPNKKDEKAEPLSRVGMVGALGISDAKASGTLAMASASSAGTFDPVRMGQAMRWDLWNPWARWFELFSTHPLVARRVAAASALAIIRGQVPLTSPLGEPARNLWPAFFRDLFIQGLPWIGALTGLIGTDFRAILAGQASLIDSILNAGTHLGLCMLLAGAGWVLRLTFSYGGDFQPRTVLDLVGEWDVSLIKSIPAELKGTIIGRGVPGLFWSKDLVLQDETGFITLVYRQPLGFLETLFGLLKAESLIGRTATIRGWYRRGPSPHLEAKELVFDDGSRVGCHLRLAAWTVAILLMGAGALLLLQ